MKKRQSKEITNPKDIEEILSISNDRASEKSLLMDFFGDFGKGARFNTYDTIIIPKGVFGVKKKNKNSFKTTVGLWVFNKGFIEPFSEILGYINETINSNKYDDINQKLTYALLENKITIDQLKEFIMKSQIIMSCASALCPSHTEELLLLTTKAEVKKKELEKKYSNGLKNKDVKAMKDIENELIDWAKEELKDSESVDMYNSGARSSWGNNFKNMYLTKGPIKQTDGSINYCSNSYITGMDKKDFADINDSSIYGPYSRARKTVTGGYEEKQFTSATQHIKVLKPGTDCGSTKYLTINLNSKNIENWMYSYVVNSNGTLTEITSENKNKFINKTVKLRFSAFCKSKNGICEKCAGTLFNRIGIENIGLGCMIIASTIKNKQMKNFHDSTMSLVKVNPDEIFL